MPRCVVSQAPKPPKVGRGVNTTKASNTAKVPKVNKVNKVNKITKVSKKVSKDNGKGKGCKSARAKKLPSTARPPREHARQTFPLSNVRGCPHAEHDAEHAEDAGHAEHADAATIAPAPRPDPPATPPGSRRSNIASKIKRLRMAPDHLLQFPQVNHRYLSAQGRILFDNRYEVHLSPPADSPKRLPRHTKAAPKATHAVAQAGSVGVRSPTLDQKVLTQEAGALRV